MSYILDAIRKSEQEQKLAVAPDMISIIAGADTVSRYDKRSNKWIVVIAVMTGVAGLLWLSRPDSVTVVDSRTIADFSAIPSVPVPPAPAQPATVPLAPAQPALVPATPVQSAPLPATPAEMATTPPKSSPANLPPTTVAPKTVASKTSSQPQVASAPATLPSVERSSKRIKARVIGIKDGCRLTVQYFKNGMTIKDAELANVACLHQKSHAGRMARRYVTEAVYTQEVDMTILEELRSGDLRIDLMNRDGTLLNRALVANGFANGSGHRFDAEEKTAQNEKKGMWTDLRQWLNESPALDSLDNVSTP
ncbi:MAG: hypothetical protein HQM03_11210 [Magnetococcales bacterium]|nr:hypothetical protein [Magnetococcales bacterium]